MDESGTKDVKFTGPSQTGAKRYFLIGVLLVEPKCYHEIVKRWRSPDFTNRIIATIREVLEFDVLHGFGNIQNVLNDFEAKLKPILLGQKNELKGSNIGRIIDDIFKKYKIPKDKVDLAVDFTYATIIENSLVQCNYAEGKVIYVDKSRIKRKGFENLIKKIEAMVGNREDIIKHIGLLLSNLHPYEKYLSRLVFEVAFNRLWKEIDMDEPIVIIADKNFFVEKKIKAKTLSIDNVVEILEVDSKDALGISLCDIMLSFTRNLILHLSTRSKVEERYAPLGRIARIDVTGDVLNKI